MVRGGDWRSEEIKVYRSVDAPSLHYDLFLNLTAKGIYGYNQTIFHFSPKMSQASKTFFLNDTHTSVTLQIKRLSAEKGLISQNNCHGRLVVHHFHDHLVSVSGRNTQMAKIQ